MNEIEILKRKRTQNARAQLSHLGLYLVLAKTNNERTRIFQLMKRLVEKSKIRPYWPLDELETKISI